MRSYKHKRQFTRFNYRLGLQNYIIHIPCERSKLEGYDVHLCVCKEEAMRHAGRCLRGLSRTVDKGFQLKLECKYQRV